MRGIRNILTPEHKIWADECVHANPGAHVGNWKKQTDATAKLFVVTPEGYKPMQGGSVYRNNEDMDTARLLKERTMLKGKKLSAYFDLTPISKRNIIGCIVAFSELQDDGTVVDTEILLPLSWVAGKDGRVIAQRLRAILAESGIDPNDVVVSVTDGGGDNHGNDKETGHGANGTIANAVGECIWHWCSVHSAQVSSLSVVCHVFDIMLCCSLPTKML